MKFVHTADWQIGMRAAHAGKAGERVREERLAAAVRVVDLANDRGADFLLLTGDTFEDHAVGRVLVQRIGDTLAGFRGPVYLLPGNHDPYVPGSVWEHPVWDSHGNLHVISTPEPIPVPGGVLLPCPVAEKHSRADPTRVIPDRENGTADGIRVGVAHGTVEGVPVEIPDFPIPADAAERAGLDYLAIGHWHSTSVEVAPRIHYAGTHEPTRFGERDSGNVLLVTITAAGAAPEIETVPTGGLRWWTVEEELRDGDDLDDVIATVEAQEDAGSTLLRVRLSGILPAAAFPGLARVGELATARFLSAQLDTDAVRPSPEDDSWLDDLPAGHVRDAASELRALAAGDGPESETAARALVELFALGREGTSSPEVAG